ncbi:MAG: alpha/beta hydrolase [Ruminococcaceae bacterium]|nr:alpha/beta hydrolase [Oscillospiraceae bacterium]
MIFIFFLLLILLFILITSYVCFYLTFYVPQKRKGQKLGFDFPDGDAYKPFKEQIRAWREQLNTLPYDTVSVTSFDGLTLRGRYYEKHKGAPIELMMHGYRGDSQRDLCGGVDRAFRIGHNVLLVDQRAAGTSDGDVISFGINESRDVLVWLDYLSSRFGNDIKVILTGISMGASTVLMSLERDLPNFVVGILADCGYSSAKDIIKLVVKDMKLPPNICYPFIKLGALLYGKFNLDELTAVDAVKKANIPIIFIHGNQDKFVPHEMSIENFNACTSEHKKLVIIDGAAHGLAFPYSPDEYVNALKEFFAYIYNN